MTRKLIPLLLIAFLIVPLQSDACLWDDDTYRQERNAFPGAVELIAGYFNRHSRTYYEWRVQKYKDRPVSELTAEEFDNLAVAYDKLGQQPLAIETILKKQKQFPETGQYRTEANLGTFLIHNGQYEEGLAHIKKAIEINPEAHFGREIYQQRLVEYLLERRSAGATAPLTPESTRDEGGFAHYVLERSGRERNSHEDNEEITQAIKGVEGMMRFGHYDSPILLEALGDLYLYQVQAGHLESSASLVAARAYSKAQLESEGKVAHEQFRTKSHDALGADFMGLWRNLESDLQKEIESGDRYFAKIEQSEKAWLSAGLDLDNEFYATYSTTPALLPDRQVHREGRPGEPEPFSTYTWPAFFCLFAATCLMIGAGLWQYRRWNDAYEAFEIEK